MVKSVEQNEAIYSNTEDDNNSIDSAFKHSFRYNCRISEMSNSTFDAKSYLQDFTLSNINLKSLYDFYNWTYYNEGKNSITI